MWTFLKLIWWSCRIIFCFCWFDVSVVVKMQGCLDNGWYNVWTRVTLRRACCGSGAGRPAAAPLPAYCKLPLTEYCWGIKTWTEESIFLSKQGSSVSVVTRLWAGLSGFDSRLCQGLFSLPPRPDRHWGHPVVTRDSLRGAKAAGAWSWSFQLVLRLMGWWVHLPWATCHGVVLI